MLCYCYGNMLLLRSHPCYGIVTVASMLLLRVPREERAVSWEILGRIHSNKHNSPTAAINRAAISHFPAVVWTWRTQRAIYWQLVGARLGGSKHCHPCLIPVLQASIRTGRHLWASGGKKAFNSRRMRRRATENMWFTLGNWRGWGVRELTCYSIPPPSPLAHNNMMFMYIDSHRALGI